MNKNERAALRTIAQSILAITDPETPTPVTAPKPARKPKAVAVVTPKAAPAKPATKGAQSRETLSRKDWNKTLTTKARLAGGTTYKTVLASWDRAADLRAKGATPDAALAILVG